MMDQVMQPDNSELLGGWDVGDAEMLEKLLTDAEPISNESLRCNDKNQLSNTPINVTSRDLSGGKISAPEPTSKQVSKKDKKTTLKKPRSPYNLFFQIERELIMSNLACAPTASSLSVSKSNSEHKGSLALEDALPDVPLPARYRGANILNPLIVINNERRKHRKVHGKIGFVQLSRQIADRWKNSDKDVKDYFKALSEKDYQRYRIESEKSRRIVSSSAMNNMVTPPLIFSGTQVEGNKSNESTIPLAYNKINLVPGANQNGARVQRRHSMGATPYQIQTFAAQNVAANKSNESTITPLANNKINLVPAPNQNCDHVHRRHSMGAAPSQVQAYTAQNVTVTQPMKCQRRQSLGSEPSQMQPLGTKDINQPIKFSRRQSLPTSFGANSCGNEVSHAAPSSSVFSENQDLLSLENFMYEPRQFSLQPSPDQLKSTASCAPDFGIGSMETQPDIDPEINDEIKLFLTRLVQE